MMAYGPRRGATLCLLLLSLFFFDKCTSIKFFHNEPSPKDDPYKVLGVKFTATNEDIQKAYRKKAKETHPDKNPSPNANEEFGRVKAAFDILGNPTSRKQHDAKVRQEIQRRRRASEQERKREEARRQQNERAKRERRRKQKDMTDRARATHGRMVRISNLGEFEKQMLDPTNKRVYGTHCLIMFVANKNAEKMGEEEIHFPYPFTGEPGKGNSYQSILRVAKVRFNTQTDLTRLFRAKSQSSTPHIIFARKGDPVGKFQLFHPNKHSSDIHIDFKKWVTSLLTIEAIIVNHHSLPVELFVLRDGHIIYNDALGPEYERTLALHAGDRILAIDQRLDSFPGGTRVNAKIAKVKGVLLMDETVTSGTIYTIQRKRCYDLSTQCYDWIMPARGKMKPKQQCSINPEFMHHVCPYTCGVCSEHFASSIGYYSFHYPIHSFPTYLQGLVRSGRYLADDIANIIKLRKNAAAAFFALGLLLAFNIIFFQSAVESNSAQLNKSTKESISNLEPGADLLLLLFAMSMCAGMEWMVWVPVEEVPLWLRGFHGDFTLIASFSEINMMLFGIGVIASSYLRILRSYTKSGAMNRDRALFFIALLLALTFAVLSAVSFTMSSNAMIAMQWRHTWKYSKNAAFAIFTVGASAGVGLVSIARLSKPLLKTSIFPAMLSNFIILAAVTSLASMDSHFKDDLMHVVRLRKNAAFGFVVFGVLIGHVLCSSR